MMGYSTYTIGKHFNMYIIAPVQKTPTDTPEVRSTPEHPLIPVTLSPCVNGGGQCLIYPQGVKWVRVVFRVWDNWRVLWEGWS